MVGFIFTLAWCPVVDGNQFHSESLSFDESFRFTLRKSHRTDNKSTFLFDSSGNWVAGPMPMKLETYRLI